MAPQYNINIFYFYLMSLFCSFSITATSSWIAQIPLQWWPLLVPIFFVLVLLSASGSGFVHLNSGTEYVLTEGAPRDPIPSPNHHVLQVASPPLERPVADYGTNGNAGHEDDTNAVVMTMAGTSEIEIEEVMSEEHSEDEDDAEQAEIHHEKTIGSECLKDECERTRVTLQMLLVAQAKFERKQEAYKHKKRRKLKRVVALVPSFRRCFL